MFGLLYGQAQKTYPGSRPRLDGTTIDLSYSPPIPNNLKFCNRCGSELDPIDSLCYDEMLEKYSL